jgi:hypothetical protein
LAKVSLKVPADRVIVRAPQERLDHLALATDDLREAGGIQTLELVAAPETSIDVQLAQQPDPA